MSEKLRELLDDLKNWINTSTDEMEHYGIWELEEEDCKELLHYINQLQQENQKQKEQLDYLRSGEYLNQLRFERDILQNIVDNGKVSEEDKTFIDMTHRNTELLEQLQSKEQELNGFVVTIAEYLEFDESEHSTYDEIIEKIVELKSCKVQLKQRDEVIDELENHCELMLRIFEKMDEQQRDKELDKFKIYDYFLRIINKYKGDNK